MTSGARGLPGPLPGVDAAWSRHVTAPDAEGVPRAWHLLDTGTPGGAGPDAGPLEPVGTVLCVHGNPTWSYLWRRVLAQAPPGWRVVAVDQLGMGLSEPAPPGRTLAQRVEDLARLTDALDLSGPLVLLAHDWGGPVGLGWALRRHAGTPGPGPRAELAGVVLTNTAVHHPGGARVPAPIRLARSSPLLDLVCRRTPGFVAAAAATCRPPLAGPVRRALAAPYDTPGRRQAVADFVRDIPLEPEHPSAPALREVADRLAAGELADVPALLLWGTRDPVFTERYLRDLVARLPHADVHRVTGASHLVLEDHPEGVETIWRWLTDHLPAPVPAAPATDRPRDPDDPGRSRWTGPPPGTPDPLPVRLHVADPEATALVELGADGRRSTVTFGELERRVRALARGLTARGVRPGHRVAVLVPPGADLTTVVYAVWRLGAVVVLADTGLGLRRLGAALRGAGPDHVVAVPRGLALARLTGVPGLRHRLDAAGIRAVLADGAATPLPPEPADDDRDGAVLFTSGATGPPKGVAYHRRTLGHQLAQVRQAFDLGPGDRLVAAFAPFALYGPALGVPSAVPAMDVTAPHTLTAAALADAVAAVEATVVFASPAALRNVLTTTEGLTPDQRAALRGPRLVLSAGAPVPATLLRRVRDLLPSARTESPYGMTEVLPVATLDPTAGPPDGGGVCVGAPLPGVTVRVAPLGPDGRSGQELTGLPGVTGELVVRAAHTKDRYDRLWDTQRASDRPRGWHRTGDVGHLDGQGRLWVQGRLAHVVTTADGPVTPYPVEERLAALPDVTDAALVGVGPRGTQQPVAVVVPRGRVGRRGAGLAGPHLAARARAAAGVPLAAVLVRDWLPVDVRHASKVDRGALATWATGLLHGRATGPARRRRAHGAPSRRSR